MESLEVQKSNMLVSPPSPPSRRTSEIKLKITLITTLDDEGALWNAYHIVDCNLIKNHTKPGMSLSFAHVVPRRKQTSS